MGFPCGSSVKNTPANAGDSGSIPGSEDLLEKEMATHHSILAWKIPWTEEPGGLQSLRLQKSRTRFGDLTTIRGSSISRESQQCLKKG